jgi:hypothetical protein
MGPHIVDQQFAAQRTSWGLPCRSKTPVAGQGQFARNTALLQGVLRTCVRPCCGVFNARCAEPAHEQHERFCAIKAAAQTHHVKHIDGEHGGYGPARIVSAGMLVLRREQTVMPACRTSNSRAARRGGLRMLLRAITPPPLPAAPLFPRPRTPIAIAPLTPTTCRRGGAHQGGLQLRPRRQLPALPWH